LAGGLAGGFAGGFSDIFGVLETVSLAVGFGVIAGLVGLPNMSLGTAFERLLLCTS